MCVLASLCVSWNFEYLSPFVARENPRCMYLLLPMVENISSRTHPSPWGLGMATCTCRYTLFDGLTYKLYAQIGGARKNASNEQNVRSYYILNRRIRDLSFYCKISQLLLLYHIFCMFSSPYMVK